MAAQRVPDLPTTLAQLRAMRADDRAAILDLLEPRGRLRVERLLRADGARRRAAPPTAEFAKGGYSPWLLARLEVPEAGGEPMTATATEMLRECARAQMGASEPVSPASTQSRLPLFPMRFRARSQST